MSKKLENIIILRGTTIYATALFGEWNKAKKDLDLHNVKVNPDREDPIDFLPGGPLNAMRFSVIADIAEMKDDMKITINNLEMFSVSGNWKIGVSELGFKEKPASRSARNAGVSRGEATRGISVHIGVNEADPDHYGSDIRLNGCVNDSIDMRQLAAKAGFNTNALTDDQATRGNVINAIKSAANELNSGDFFLLTYAGHGSQITDTTNMEADGNNETWCLFDGMLIDDELYELWTQFKPGVRVLVLSDSCHSGTISRGLDEATFQSQQRGRGFTPRNLDFHRSMTIFNDHLDFYENILKGLADRKVNEKSVNAHVRLISGCQDNQLSYELGGGGEFTARLKEVWNVGRFSGNYSAFTRQIVDLMPSYQTPNHYLIGINSRAYNNEKPFTIQQEGMTDVTSRGLAALVSRGHHNGGSFGKRKVAQKV